MKTFVRGVVMCENMFVKWVNIFVRLGPFMTLMLVLRLMHVQSQSV